MLKRLEKITICGLISMALILASSAAGLSIAGRNDAYAAAPKLDTWYLVKPGDSLYKISKAYGITVGSLKAANNQTSDIIYVGSWIKIPMALSPNEGKSLKSIISGWGLNVNNLQLNLFIDKSDKRLTAYSGTTPLKSYHVELGDGGPGDKKVSGDHKTPEGSFLTSVTILSLMHRVISFEHVLNNQYIRAIAR